MILYKHNPTYTDSFNDILENHEVIRNWFFFWCYLTITLILMSWFWTGMPELLRTIESGSTPIFLIILSIVYRHIFWKALFFVAGFLGLVTFLSTVLA